MLVAQVIGLGMAAFFTGFTAAAIRQRILERREARSIITRGRRQIHGCKCFWCKD